LITLVNRRPLIRKTANVKRERVREYSDLFTSLRRRKIIADCPLVRRSLSIGELPID
jgi:hypothetical protein